MDMQYRWAGTLNWLLGGLLLIALMGCKSIPQDASVKHTLAWKKSTYQLLRSNLDLPLSKRMMALPDELIQDVTRNDTAIGIESAASYRSRPPSFSETSEYQSYLALLPDSYIELMDDKLLGIFLVEHFAGAGLSDWVVDDRGETYYFMILNPELFKNSVDQWMSYREDSIFEPRQSDDEFHIRVSTQVNHSAMLYALMHEGAHLVDYEHGITPVVEDLFTQVTNGKRNHSPFAARVWSTQTVPLPIYDYEGRDNLNVYGIFPRRGLLPRKEAPRLFEELRLTPFVSFYASTNWNEHLADYVMYWHIENHLLGRVTLQLWKGDTLMDQYHPLLATLQPDNRRVLQHIYRESR
jgi:hypothetical protein